MTFGSELSKRIDMLRFTLVVGLVLLHYGAYPDSELSPFQGLQPTPHPAAAFVNSFVLFFFLCAVPVLSAISGWLFFKHLEPSARFFGRRIKARARSILLPMTIWNAAVLGAFVAAGALLRDPRVSAMAAYDVTGLDATATVNAIVGVTRYPIAYQLWFLHDLMLTVIFAPLLWLALRFAALGGAVALALVWFLDYDVPLFFRTDVLLFFYAGAFAQVRALPIARPAPQLGPALLAVFIVLVGARAIGPYFIAEQSPAGVVLFDYGTRLMRIVGAAAVWLCSALLVDTRVGNALCRCGPVAFFLYAAHWPLNQVFKHGLDALMPVRNDLTLLINYALTGALTVAATILAARALNAVLPSVYDVLSGGRSAMWSLRCAAPTATTAAERPSRP